jgi:hypothetical protein
LHIVAEHICVHSHRAGILAAAGKAQQGGVIVDDSAVFVHNRNLQDETVDVVSGECYGEL